MPRDILSLIRTLAWKQDYLEILDQTRLPETETYLRLSDIESVFRAIQQLQIRGAPAIGITAAYGLYLGMRNDLSATREAFFLKLRENIRYLASARPTAVNLLWALQELERKLRAQPGAEVKTLKERLLALAIELHADDARRCEKIGEHGQKVVPHGARILTHCNAGALATGGIGTALGVIYRAQAEGKDVQVYADETRPVLQGARLTLWELTAVGVPAQLICDNMAAALMRQKKVDLVIVGADRIAADGATANKIGTYGLAILAKYHATPFYVAAPLSTFDLTLDHGDGIPIEMRNEQEVRCVFNKTLITLPEAKCWNPAFDVTPPQLITGIITEQGIIEPPFDVNIRAMLAPVAVENRACARRE